jgi:hypothetical protein
MAVRLNSHGPLPDMVLHVIQDIVRPPARPNVGAANAALHAPRSKLDDSPNHLTSQLANKLLLK